MSDVLTKDELMTVKLLREEHRLREDLAGGYALPPPKSLVLIERLVAEVDRLRARNEALATTAKAFLHQYGGPIPKFCIWPNVQIHGGCLKAGRKPFGCESYQEPQCNECRAHDSVAKAILSALNPSETPNSSGGAPCATGK